MSQLLLGCIADDFTGGTDLASTLVRAGMRTLQVIGVPEGPLPDDIDAVVIALKSRTISAEEAVTQSLEALEWLRAAGCQQFFFKYCSTFDSTSRGNIGPVADALADALGVSFAVACPAFPENKRTIFNGHLFVGEQLLSESGMRNHPLTPMTDSNLVRVLQQQTLKPVGLVAHSVVSKGAQAISTAFSNLEAQGQGYAIVDAIDDEDLYAIGGAVADHKLVTGGSGVALGLPENFRRAGLLGKSETASVLPAIKGLGAVVSGSCSVATNSQVEHWQKSRPSFSLDPLLLANGHDQVAQALAWAKDLIQQGPILIYGSAQPETVKLAQQKLGVEAAGQIVEDALSAVAVGLYEMGVRKLVVAGGETSGAVVKALKIKALRIGATIDPGVPWTLGLRDDPVALALKSGNFGTVDFFEKALANAP
ncbi:MULTISPECIES: 3-oxo-tetronate kinase [unclassified Pseudomonas]|uniref:3-oxo-tetronate kinase n=1 Tax=unclassified Pseudomonas TaxID=196821 RepID=UPI000B401F9F|nr:3-oxo-tetronate kinase [Pseudomonas sp. PE-S1G-1]NWD85657.1 four-carbon acid sugar kinase family protein [Pseudomonas sp. K5002]